MLNQIPCQPLRIETLEPERPPFSGMALDRAATLRRDPSDVAEQMNRPDSLAVAAGRDGVLVDDDGEALARRAHTSQLVGHGEPILLGIEAGHALFAVDLEALEPTVAASFAQGASVVGLRDAGAILSRSEAGLAAYTVAMLNWHRGHRFCANCGAGTAIAEAGYSRRCPNCGAVHFPRTDPAVIMLVENDGRLLLGRRAGWPRGRYSVLAGFVSPGESLEEAVVREVREESGIVARDPAFVTSQPWPFPSSLMLGFEARSDGGQPSARDGELEDVQWFTREMVSSAVLEGDSELLRLPPRVSIARYLIERWLVRPRRTA